MIFAYSEEVKQLKETIKEVKKNFRCLQCGYCCWRFFIKPTRSYSKPEKVKCKYLECIHAENGQWKQAKCRIHNSPTFPLVCREAVFGLDNVCILGIEIWRIVITLFPKRSIPDDVRKIIDEKVVDSI